MALGGLTAHSSPPTLPGCSPQHRTLSSMLAAGATDMEWNTRGGASLHVLKTGLTLKLCESSPTRS
jgi:hypothetical protein